MPSGARSTEQGRPRIWPIIHPPTASKYRARSSLVTGSPSPPFGHSALSGFEIATPITSAAFFTDDLTTTIEGFEVEGFEFESLVVFFIDGFSATTSSAGLSWRNPLNAACLMLPSSVQPANSISATNSGFSQWTSRVFAGASLPPNGLSSEAAFFNAGMMRRTVSWPKPVPTIPTYSRSLPRWTPAISERNFPLVVFQPPSTTSCPSRILVLVQLSDRPER